MRLVAYSLPNTDPVHKVSIIPRGLAALGYTMQRPEQDRFLMTQSELESRIQVLLAGTVAEEMIFSDVSSGAQNDLERATEIARSMVMDLRHEPAWPDQLPRIEPQPVFVSRAWIRLASQHHSEQTAREIDQEVKRILDEGLQRTRHILETRRAALEADQQAAIKQEVIDSTELKRIIEEHSSSPMIVPGTDADGKKRTTAPTPNRPATSTPPKWKRPKGCKQALRPHAIPLARSAKVRKIGLSRFGLYAQCGRIIIRYLDLRLSLRFQSAAIESTPESRCAPTVIKMELYYASTTANGMHPPLAHSTATPDCDNSRGPLIAVGLVVLLIAVVWPNFPAVTGVALIAVGATRCGCLRDFGFLRQCQR